MRAPGEHPHRACARNQAMATHPRAVLITGCSSGICMEAAADLAARGYRVIATSEH